MLTSIILDQILRLDHEHQSFTWRAICTCICN